METSEKKRIYCNVCGNVLNGTSFDMSIYLLGK